MVVHDEQEDGSGETGRRGGGGGGPGGVDDLLVYSVQVEEDRMQHVEKVGQGEAEEAQVDAFIQALFEEDQHVDHVRRGADK